MWTHNQVKTLSFCNLFVAFQNTNGSIATVTCVNLSICAGFSLLVQCAITNEDGNVVSISLPSLVWDINNCTGLYSEVRSGNCAAAFYSSDELSNCSLLSLHRISDLIFDNADIPIIDSSTIPVFSSYGGSFNFHGKRTINFNTNHNFNFN